MGEDCEKVEGWLADWEKGKDEPGYVLRSCSSLFS